MTTLNVPTAGNNLDDAMERADNIAKGFYGEDAEYEVSNSWFNHYMDKSGRLVSFEGMVTYESK